MQITGNRTSPRPRRPLTLLGLMLAAALLTAVFPAASAPAKNVDLVTLPRRDTVQLTIYNSEDLTLAKETRFITLKKGDNRLQFSWAGTLIDPSSVELRPLAQADAIEVVDTRYPGQKPQHLIWTIRSDVEGQVPVEVSYFTSGLTWQMDYVAIADAEETSLDFRGYVRVFNNSGEEYENAEIRLIVGKINLVEKIAALARQAGDDDTPTDAKRNELRGKAIRMLADFAEKAEEESSRLGEKKGIVKDGVSEYFMFSIEGRETIRNGWSKRLQAVSAQDVKFDIVYRMRAYQYGPQPVRFFIWENTEANQLGDSPLPNGMIRVFRENQLQGLGYLGQQSLEYVPVMSKIEVNLGHDDLVVFQQRQDGAARTNFAFHPSNKQVIGWDESQRWWATIRNYHQKPITLELRLQHDGDVELASPQPTRSIDYRTVETVLGVEPLNQRHYAYSMMIHLGTNAKQNRLLLRAAP